MTEPDSIPDWGREHHVSLEVQTLHPDIQTQEKVRASPPPPRQLTDHRRGLLMSDLSPRALQVMGSLEGTRETVQGQRPTYAWTHFQRVWPGMNPSYLRTFFLTFWKNSLKPKQLRIESVPQEKSSEISEKLNFLWNILKKEWVFIILLSSAQHGLLDPVQVEMAACPGCGKIFSSRNKLKYHIQRMGKYHLQVSMTNISTDMWKKLCPNLRSFGQDCSGLSIGHFAENSRRKNPKTQTMKTETHSRFFYSKNSEFRQFFTMRRHN